MKTNDPGNDKDLRNLLKEWSIDAPLPPRFQETVWRRIEQAERAPTPVRPPAWAVLAHWIETMLQRPALASAYVAVLLAIGVTAGWTQGRNESARVKGELSDRYVRVLDPYVAPRE